MATYLRTQDNREFRIKSNGCIECDDHQCSQPFWREVAVPPQGRRIVDLREAMGANCECKCDDGRWYKFAGSGLELTDEEKRNDYNRSRSQSKSKSSSSSTTSSSSSSFISGVISKGLDSYNSRQERKAAEMDAEREAWQAQRDAEREEERRALEAFRNSREYKVKCILGDEGQLSYQNWINHLLTSVSLYSLSIAEIAPYLYDSAIYGGDELSEQDNFTPSSYLSTLNSITQKCNNDAVFTEWLKKFELNTENKSTEEWSKDFIIKFPDPELGYQAKIGGLITEMYYSKCENQDELIPYLAKLTECKIEDEKFRNWMRQFERNTNSKPVFLWIQEYVSEFPDPEAVREAREKAQAKKLIKTVSSIYENKWIAATLALFFGIFGAHQFYLRNSKRGYIYLGLTLLSPLLFGVPLIIVIVLTIIDIIKILTTPQIDVDALFD